MVSSLLRLIVRQMKTTYDLKPALLLSLTLPSLLYIAVASLAYNAIIPPFRIGEGIMSYASFFLPGIVLVQTVGMSILGGLMYWTDKNSGMLERLFSMPFPRSYYFISRVFSLLLSNLVVAGVLLVIGLPIVYSDLAISPASVGLVVLSITATCLFFASLSLLVTPFLRTADSVTVFSRSITMPVIIVSSAFYPLGSAPQLIRDIAGFNPLSYAADILRFALFGLSEGNLPISISIVVSTTVLTFLLAVYAFENRIQLDAG